LRLDSVGFEPFLYRSSYCDPISQSVVGLPLSNTRRSRVEFYHERCVGKVD
jgi:hypothetical protein